METEQPADAQLDQFQRWIADFEPVIHGIKKIINLKMKVN